MFSVSIISRLPSGKSCEADMLTKVGSSYLNTDCGDYTASISLARCVMLFSCQSRDINYIMKILTPTDF